MEIVWLGALLLAFPIIAIVALVKTINLGERLRVIEQRFEALELQLCRCARRGAAAQPEPAAPPPAAVAPPDRLSRTSARTNSPLRGRRASRANRSRRPSRAPASGQPSPTPEPTLSFEERFGTRWMVWVGGLALALGGIFLVHYSIEQGLIGPKLRLFFGALLARGADRARASGRGGRRICTASATCRARTSRAS